MSVSRKRPTSTRSQLFRLLRLGRLIFLLLVILGALTWHYKTTSNEKAATPVSLTTSSFEAKLQSVITANPDITFGLAVIPLKPTDGSPVYINANAPFFAASIGKLVAATDYLHGVEQGTYNLNDMLGIYSSSFQLQQLINQSNNDSWGLFNDLLTLPGEQKYAESIGLTAYKADQNEISVKDAATILTKLYQGGLLNPDDTKLLLSYMQNTEEERFIPAAFTSTQNLYHKIGLYETYAHDAALVENPTHPYVLVIFSDGQGIQDYPARAAMFGKLTKAVTTVFGE